MEYSSKYIAVTVVALFVTILLIIIATIADFRMNRAVSVLAIAGAIVSGIAALIFASAYGVDMKGVAIHYYTGYVTDDSGDHVKSLLFKYDGTTYVVDVDSYDAYCISLKMRRGITADKNNLVKIDSNTMTVYDYDPSLSNNMKVIRGECK